MPRIKTIEIDETRCDGCGKCVFSCPEGVIAINDGKARVVKEALCDGLGNCIPVCPQGAIRLVEKEVMACPHATVTQDLKWPVQLQLISPLYRFSQKELVIAADCTAFSSPHFHEILGGRRVLVACPKFDDSERVLKALRTIFHHQALDSLEIILMEVPCCLRLQYLIEQALEDLPLSIPLTVTMLGIDGTVKARESIRPREQKSIGEVHAP